MVKTEETNSETVVVPEKRSGWKRWVLLGALVVLVAGAIVYWRSRVGMESTDDAQIDGRVHAVSARVGGTVVKLLVQDNQYVEAGTVLLEIDPRDYQVAEARAKADLAEAEARLHADTTQVPIVTTTTTSQVSSAQASVEEQKASVAAAEQGVAVAQARLVSAQAQVARVRASAARAAKDQERYKALVDKEEISQQQYDAAVSEASSLRAQLDAAVAQENEAQQGVRVAQAQVLQQRAKQAKAEADAQSTRTGPEQVAATQAQAASSSARVQQMKAALDQSQLNLQYTIVRAPTSGVISQRTVEVGQNVQPGQPLLAVVSLDDIWVVANFKEGQIANMRKGQAVDLKVDAVSGRTFRGHVDSLAAGTGAKFSLLPAENATGNFVKVVQRVPVKITIDKGQDPEHILRPGLSVVPTVNTRQ